MAQNTEPNDTEGSGNIDRVGDGSAKKTPLEGEGFPQPADHAPTRIRPLGELLPKERIFVEHWIASHNATQSAIRAGYSPNRADRAGQQLLQRPRVAKAIRERLAVLMVQHEVTAEKALRETALLAFSSIADYALGKDGVLRLSSKHVDPAAIRSVQSYRRREKVLRRTYPNGECVEQLLEVDTEIKLYDKTRALGYLLQLLGLLKQPTPAQTEDPVRELLKRLPADMAAALGAILAGTESRSVEPGDGGAGALGAGSGSEPDSGVSPVS